MTAIASPRGKPEKWEIGNLSTDDGDASKKWI